MGGNRWDTSSLLKDFNKMTKFPSSEETKALVILKLNQFCMI